MKQKKHQWFPALLAAVLAIAALFPLRAFADDLPCLPCEAWEGDFAAIAPIGDAPWAKVRLTPTGAEITERYFPAQYEVVFKDGSSETVSAENCEETTVGGYAPMIRITFDAEINGETFTFFAEIMYHESEQNCSFRAGHEGTAADEAGQMKAFRHYVYTGPCDTTVEKGDAFRYAAHRISYLLWEIRNYIRSFFILRPTAWAGA